MSPPKEHLTKKAAKSIFWNMLSGFSVSGLRFISTAILARILFPEDFGLIGMAFVFTSIVSLFGNMGLGHALIQRQAFDDKSLSTAFWSEQAVGVTLAIGCIAIAPLAEVFYKEPAVKWIIMSLSLNFILTSIAGMQALFLYKDLRFKELAIAEIISTIFRIALVISFALMDFGFWSIIIGIIGERALKTFIFYIMVPWRPKFIFCKVILKDLFSYGKHLYAQSFLNYFNGNLDYLIIGRVLGAAQLGYYQFAYNLPHLVLELISSKIAQTLFPMLSKVQHETERLRTGLYKGVMFQSIIIFPILFGLMHQAHNFIFTAYGERWLAAVHPLQILCLCSLIASIGYLNGSFLNATGRPDVNFKISAISLPILIGCILYFSKWGIIGIAIAMTITQIIGLSLIYFCIKRVEDTFFNYIKVLFPAIISSLIMMASLSILKLFLTPYALMIPIRLMINVIAGACFYTLSLRIIFKTSFFDCLDFLKNLRKN